MLVELGQDEVKSSAAETARHAAALALGLFARSRPGHIGRRHLFGETPEQIQAEMGALMFASKSRRSVYLLRLVLPGDTQVPEEIDATVITFLDKVGLTNHCAVWGLHDSGGRPTVLVVVHRTALTDRQIATINFSALRRSLARHGIEFVRSHMETQKAA